jgi:hypothetical protein
MIPPATLAHIKMGALMHPYNCLKNNHSQNHPENKVWTNSDSHFNPCSVPKGYMKLPNGYIYAKTKGEGEAENT